MIPLVAQNLDNIKILAKKHHVSSLSIFGSAVTDDFNQNSDIDFLYSFDLNRLPIEDYAAVYFDLLFSLKDLLKREVDLISEKQINNKYFKSEIERTKVLLYE